MAADQAKFDRLQIKLRGKLAAVTKARVQCKAAQKALDAAQEAGEGVEAAETKLSTAQAGLKAAEEEAAEAEKALKDEQERLERAGVTVTVEIRPKPSPVARGPTQVKSPMARPRPGPPPASLVHKPSAAAPAGPRPPRAPKSPKPAAPKTKPPTPQAIVHALAEGLPPPAPTTVSAPAEPAAVVHAPVQPRFPMEDSEIDEINPGRPTLHEPRWMSSVDDSARLAAALYICEGAGHFGAALGLAKPLRLAALQRALADDASPAATAPLSELYYRLLSFHLEDACSNATATDKDTRLMSVLTAATWPEVLRQWLSRRAAAAAAAAAGGTEEAGAEAKGDVKGDASSVSLPPAEHLKMALAGLAAAGADGIGPDTHLALLHWLLDEAISSDSMRDAIQEIEDAASEKQKKLKELVAAQRRKIKALKDAAKAAEQQQMAPAPDTARPSWGEVLKVSQARQAEIQACKDAISRAQEELEASQESQTLRCVPLGSDRQHRLYWVFPHADPAAVYVDDEATGLWGVISTPEDVQMLVESLDWRGQREVLLSAALKKRRAALEKAMMDAKSDAEAVGKNGKDAEAAEEIDLVSSDDEEAAAAAAVEEEEEDEEEGRRGKRVRRLPQQFDPVTGKLVGGEAAAAARAASTALSESSDEEEEEDFESKMDAQQKNRWAKEKEKRRLEAERKAAVPVPCFKLNKAAAAAAVAPLLGPCEALAFADTLARLLEVRELASAAGVTGPGTSDLNWAIWTANSKALARGQVQNPSGEGFVPTPNAAALCAALQARALELEAAVVDATKEIAGMPAKQYNGTVAVEGSGSDSEDGTWSEAEELAAAGPSVDLFLFEIFRGADTAVQMLPGISTDKFFPSNVNGKALWRHRRDRLAWRVAASQQDVPVANVAYWVQIMARQASMLLGGEVKAAKPAAKAQPKAVAAGRGGQRKRADPRRKKAEKESEEEDMDLDVVDLAGEEEEEEEEKPVQRGGGKKRGRGGPPPGAAGRRTGRAKKT